MIATNEAAVPLGQYHHAVAGGSLDCRLSIVDFGLASADEANRQSKIGNRKSECPPATAWWYRPHGTLDWVKGRIEVSQTIESKNKALVLEAFDTLFNKRDYRAAERYWSPDYIQHSAHIEPGREGLFNLIKSLPPTLRYESGTIIGEGNFVIVHGRFSGFGALVNWIAADILRIENGLLVEHWDVIQDEATEEQSKSKAPMFGTSFPKNSAQTTTAKIN